MRTVKAPKAFRFSKPPPAVRVQGSGPDFAPVPRRVHRPRWLDPRIIGGLLLVIAAVVAGARVVGASSRTNAVWSASHDIAAGTVLTAGDITSVDVNLGDNAGRYVLADPARNTVIGHALTVSVRGGELLPLSALSDVNGPANGRIIVIGVSPDHMPPGVGHGSKIDLYLIEGSGSGSQTTTSLISSGITVQSVTAPASGGLSGATSNRYQVAVLLDSGTADKLIRTLPRGDPVVALFSGR